jgi:hypothetical protein
MTPGPLRRLLGAVGLLALLPVSVRLATGALSAEDAAARAVITLLVVVVLGRLSSAWLGHIATTYERNVPATDRRGAAES